MAASATRVCLWSGSIGGGAILFDPGDLSPLSLRDLLRVSHVWPFHFSPRYEPDEAWMLGEVAVAFTGKESNASSKNRTPASNA